MCIMLTICDVSVESQDIMVFYVLNYFLSKEPYNYVIYFLYDIGLQCSTLNNSITIKDRNIMVAVSKRYTNTLKYHEKVVNTFFFNKTNYIIYIHKSFI